VEEPGQIRPALERAVASGLPAVLDVRVDPEIHMAPPDLDTLGGIWLEGCELPEA
jgi:thiamine pyrophosphate-dependent acetolactate synthase large subunit-like protein